MLQERFRSSLEFIGFSDNTLFSSNLQTLPNMPDYQAEKGIEAFTGLFYR